MPHEYPIEYFVINLMKMKRGQEAERADEDPDKEKVNKGVSEQIEYTIEERKQVTEVLINLAENDPSVLEIETL
jgi:hypothetical protein